MKGRFVVVDYGEVVHQRNQPCPPWCHLCPHMDGAVMPSCWGSVAHADHEHDLLACHCDPNDPIVAHADLVARTDRVLAMLRERRSSRIRSANLLRRLNTLASAMRFSSASATTLRQREAWEEAESLVQQLLSECGRDACRGETTRLDPAPKGCVVNEALSDTEETDGLSPDVPSVDAEGTTGKDQI